MLITGTITDKDGKPLDKVYVALKNSQFQDLVSTQTDKEGQYSLEAQAGYYPFLIAVKEYKENYLEYWCQNINLLKDLRIDASIDKLEIYGLHCFQIKGAYPALTLYFRPMSLGKFKKGDKDISPNMTKDSITATINKQNTQVLKVNKLEEYCGEINLTSYLIQVSLPENLLDKNENFLDLKILDLDGYFGQASIFF